MTSVPLYCSAFIQSGGTAANPYNTNDMILPTRYIRHTASKRQQSLSSHFPELAVKFTKNMSSAVAKNEQE